MTTLAKKRIKDVFQDTLKNVSLGKTPDIKNTMIKHGYALTSANSQKVVKTKTWQELLTDIDDNLIIDKLKEILNSDDKRSALTSADMLLKLKDRYPAQKKKIIGLMATLGEITEDEDPPTNL